MNDNICKILISYHKKDYLFGDNILTPIHVGRAISNENEWLSENMIGDNTGENISLKNASYNEMTSVYWAWKNYNDLGNPDWVGFMHYRRHFLFSDGDKPYYEFFDLDETYLDKIGYSEDRILEYLENIDFLTVKPHWRVSMYEHFKNNHKISDLDLVVELLEETYPEYKKAAQTYLSGTNAYFCNMFIFKRETFFEYASWMFDLLEQFEEKVDLTGKRLFISEWLTGIFIQKMIDDGKKGKFLPTSFVEGIHSIPVVMAADSGYAMPMSVTVASLLENAQPNTHYDIYLMVPEDFSNDLKRKFFLYMQLYPRCTINFINMGLSFQDVTITTQHLTKVSFYRLKIPELLSHCNKCIYIDVDTIVYKDLSTLFRTSLAEYYIAGVKAAGYHFEESKRFHQERLNLPNVDEYINAGILLMNLELIRQDRIYEKFEELSKQKFSSEDQDIINVSCFGNIKCLPPRYNSMTKYYYKKDSKILCDEKVLSVYKKNEIMEAINNPTIIHYADKRKPWKDNAVPFYDIWSRFEKISVIREQNTATTHSDSQKNSDTINYELRKVKNELAFAQQEIKDIRKSATYRLGRFITFIPRKMRSGKRCLKENGLSYTLSRLKQKILFR